MKNLSLAAVLFIAGYLSSSANAHHSFTSHFDPSKTYEMKGVLTKFVSRNPHSFFFVDVVGKDGVVEEWEVELGSKVHMSRMGINQDTFKVGDRISVAAWPNRKPNQKFVYGISFVDARGKRYGEVTKDDIASAENTSAGVKAVFGRWYSPLPHLQKLPPLPLNKVGLLAEASYIPALSPATLCEPATIPDLQLSPYMTDIRMIDGKIEFIHEAYNVTRSIPLNSPQVAVEDTSWMGIAAARIEGDELVIESSKYPVSRWGLGAAAQPRGSKKVDYPSSPLKTVVERYSVSDDGRTLILTFTVTDPVYLKEPYTAKMTARRVADDEPMYPFECEVDAAARFAR